ncbi:MAG: TraR/DksA family transcriptional regulator [Pseudomonadota bacterium]|nr:TraR/DksA family transcriptional regulator [Pseudomonadota bacterium]
MGHKKPYYSTTEIAETRLKLESRKQVLIQTQADYQVEAKTEPRKDIPDLANEEVKFSLAASLVGFEQQQIKEVEGALNRLNNGTYGFCGSCDEAINSKRLKAMPEARLCIMCSRAQEESHEKVGRTSNISRNMSWA